MAKNEKTFNEQNMRKIIRILSGLKSQADELANKGVDARVVSMPSFELFDAQDEAYKESVMPRSVRARVAVEALSSFGWHKYTGLDGEVISLDKFGASGPAAKLFEKYGFTVENVVNTAKKVIGK